MTNSDALLNSVPGLGAASTSDTFPVSLASPAAAAIAAAVAAIEPVSAPSESVGPVAPKRPISNPKNVTFEIPASISSVSSESGQVLTAKPPKKSNGGRPRKRKEMTPSSPSSGSSTSFIVAAESAKRRKMTPSSTRTPTIPMWGSGISKRKRVYFFGSSPTDTCQISDVRSDPDSFFIGDESCRIYAASMQTIYQSVLCLDAIQQRKEISVCKSVGDANKKAWTSSGSGSIKEFLADFKIGEPTGKVTKFNFHNCADCTAAPGNGSAFTRQSTAFLDIFLSKYAPEATADPVAGDKRRKIYLVGHACFQQEKNKTRDPDGIYVHFRILYRILQYGYNSLSIDTLMRGISKMGDYPPVCYTYCSCKSKPEGCNATECVPGFSELPNMQQINEFNDKYAQHPEIALVHPQEHDLEPQENVDAAENILIEETNSDAMDTAPSAGMAESWPSPHEEFETAGQVESPISDLYARYGIDTHHMAMEVDPITVSGSVLDNRFIYDEPVQGF